MSDQQWYRAEGGNQVGPMSEAELATTIRKGEADASTLVYTAGMANWIPLGDVPRLRTHLPEEARSLLPVPAGRIAHEIDYHVQGVEMQYVEIELDPGESAVAEAGGMMYMHGGIAMETVFGDGSEPPRGGFMNKLLGAGKRLLTGESLFMTVFTNNAHGKARVAFAAPYAGKILPMDLSQLGGELICQKDAFLCAAKGVSIGIAFQKKIGVGLFGGEGFILQKLEGDGLAFVHAGGTVVERDLAAGETLRLDTGCLVAFERQVDYDIQTVPGIKTALFGGEGLFFASLTGPGKVWIQSLPFSRLASRVYAAAPQTGGTRKGEGSVLGGLGGLVMGDRR
jgi:uncharacterized protein (TIGR00266 family)